MGMDLVMYGVVPMVSFIGLIVCVLKKSPMALFWFVLLVALFGLPAANGHAVDGSVKFTVYELLVAIPLLLLVCLAWLCGRGRD